jgi:hypothetical protein
MFDGTGPATLQSEVAGIINRNKRMRFDDADPNKPFDRVWESAKFYVGASLMDRAWRYNYHPSIPALDIANPLQCRVTVRARWHRDLSGDATGKLYGILMYPPHVDMIHSICSKDVLGPRGKHFSRKPVDEFYLKLSLMCHNLGDDMTKALMDRIELIKWLALSDDGTAEAWMKEQREAVDWITDVTKTSRRMVETFVESWALRFQGQLSYAPDWATVNRIFLTTGDIPIPTVLKDGERVPLRMFGWSPVDTAPKPTWVGLDGVKYADNDGDKISMSETIPIRNSDFDSCCSSRSLFYGKMDKLLGWKEP